MTAQPPSFILEALAAVIVPVLLKAGLSCEILASLYFLGSSSSVMCSSAVLDLITTGTIYSL